MMRFLSSELRSILLLLAILLVGQQLHAQQAQRPTLQLPVHCEIGVTCLVQKLMDIDDGPGRRDYRCGLLTTDGHKGMDIRLRTMADMSHGYHVVAAAPGIVRRLRDGEPDVNVNLRGDLNGKLAGNSVVVDHGDGWETQYSHLKLGSVSVKPGQQVKRGDMIGKIGMSGNTEFPHLHFEIRHRGQVVDPFTGKSPPARCDGQTLGHTLWNAQTIQMLKYQPTVVISGGLVSTVPSAQISDRVAVNPRISSADALLMWIEMIGVSPGDVVEFRITGPDGESLHEQRSTVAVGGLIWFGYSGRKAPKGGWHVGKYRGTCSLKRAGILVAHFEVFDSVS